LKNNISLQRQICLYIIGFTLITAGTLSYFFNKGVTRGMRNEINSRLLSSIAISALIIDSNLHDSIKSRIDEHGGRYKQIKKDLQLIRDSIKNINDVYTMRLGKDGRIRFVVDAEENPDEIAHVDDIYKDASKMLKKNFFTMKGPMVEKDFYTDKWGTWLTAYTPIFDSDGKRYGILAMDIAANSVKQETTRTLLITFLIFACTTIPFCIVAWFFGKGLAAKLKKTIDDLNESEKARDALSHMIVHDLRNPLMAIQGVVGLLQMVRNSLPENIVKTLQQIQGATEEMDNLISSILDISKIESGTMSISPVILNATDLAYGVTEDTKVIYDVAGVSIKFIIKDKNLNIFADKELTRRILKNLLSNSLKFTPEESVVELTLEKQKDNAVFRVNDEGPGISLELRNKIFNKFYQISSREVKKQSGVGLGLAFCRMAAEAMNGEIGVEDRPDSKQGSSFYIKLPLRK